MSDFRVVLSLFDGISCGRVALDRCGKTYDTYLSSEIDQKASEVVVSNYGDYHNLGDILLWREWSIDWSAVDLILAGSPCQGFSFAGRQEGLDDPRSSLFFTFIEILNHVKSCNTQVKFILENVKMSKVNLDILSSHVEVEPVFINSSIFSGQSRQRFYWCNFSIPELPSGEESPNLTSILDGDYYSDREKSFCIDANYGKGSNLRRYLFCGSRQIVFETGYYPEGATKDTANDVTARDGKRWRLLTPEECEVLQTLPIGYTSCVTKGHRYKALGNGWTVDVICHILKGIP